MRAVRIHRTGGPEVLTVDEVDDPSPGPGQVVVDVVAAGLNFIDTYHRSGAYSLNLPTTLGQEGAGHVAAVGDGVGSLAVGDRVAWTGVSGSYADKVIVPADKAVSVPEQLDLDVAAACMLQGLTAHYLASSTFPLGPGHVALATAGAGGVGQLLLQIAKARGAELITTVSTEEKAELAREAGADHVVRYTDEDIVERVTHITDGAGVDVVYDSVGRATFDASLQVLKPRGYLVLYGQSSGAVAPLDPQRLAAGGSLFLTRPTLGNYTADRAELQRRVDDLFGWLISGDVRLRIDRRFGFHEAAEAHRYIEGRKTKGKVLLVPDTGSP